MEIKLKLKIKDMEIELSTNEAKELCKALEMLTGEKTKEIIRETYPYFIPTYPTYPWYDGTWTCGKYLTTLQLNDCISVSYEVT